MTDLAIATCMTLPEPDADAGPLAAALEEAGIDAEVLAWDDPRAEFAAAKLCVIRSTWNYSEQPEAFAAWVRRTAGVTALWNGEGVVLWNMHKSYLLDLEGAGVRAVPTRLVPRGAAVTLDAMARELGAETLVVKPAVSGASRGTLRVTPDRRARGEAHLAAMLAVEDALVQPYVASIEGYGERALVWIDGELTHAIRKSPRFLGDPERASEEAMPIAVDEAALAMRAVAFAKERGPLLYARIDMARDDAGSPQIMELELIEPSLFFPQSPAALARYVRAIGTRIGRS